MLDECVAIGSTSKGTETWEPGGPEVHVEAVALPPLPGTENLPDSGVHATCLGKGRTLGGLDTAKATQQYSRPTRTRPSSTSSTTRRSVGDPGFARALRLEHPGAYDDYASWKSENPKTTTLGAVHMVGVRGDNRFVVSLVAQKGYGKSAGPRFNTGRSTLRCTMHATSSGMRACG